MALWICTGCTATYSVGAARCPQCGETEHIEEGAADMAKITVHGGPSNELADQTEAGEDVSATGTSSSTSSETPSPSTEPSDKQGPSRAPGAESRSEQTRTTQQDDTANSTATSGRKTDGPDSDEASK